VSPGAESADVMTGRDCVWKCTTADGRTGAFVTDGQTYDLAKGNVFLVHTANDGGITQLTVDLSITEMKHESFSELAKRYEVIGKFVADAKPSELRSGAWKTPMDARTRTRNCGVPARTASNDSKRT